MNPLENDIREVLKHHEPPAGFAERVISQVSATRHLKVPRWAAFRFRLTAPAIVIVIAAALVGAAGLFMTRCASACSFGSSTELERNLGITTATFEGGHSRGPKGAELVLEEFGDYECPSCGGYFPIVEEIIHRFPDQIRFEYHHFPLTGIHANAMGAAIAAEAAGDQNHFWDMHELLYQHQGEWARTSNPEMQFEAYARRIGLDMNRFRLALQSTEIKRLVLDDIKRGQEARIGGTPTFFANGKAIPLPATANEFTSVIEHQLSRK